jgi:DNA-binding transcriptional LysR family regulator
VWYWILGLAAARGGIGWVISNELLGGDVLRAGALAEVGTSDIYLDPYILVAQEDRWSEPRLAAFREWLTNRLAADSTGTPALAKAPVVRLVHQRRP